MGNRLLRNASEYTKSVLTYEKLDDNNNYNLLLNKMDGSSPITLIDTRYWNKRIILRDSTGEFATIYNPEQFGDQIITLPNTICNSYSGVVLNGNGNRLLYSNPVQEVQYEVNRQIDNLELISWGQDTDEYNIAIYVNSDNDYLLEYIFGITDYPVDLTNNNCYLVYNNNSYQIRKANVISGHYMPLKIITRDGLFDGNDPIQVSVIKYVESSHTNQILESNIEIDSEDELILNGDDTGETYFWVKGTLPKSNLINVIDPPPYLDPISNRPPLSGINLGFGLGQTYAGIYFLRDNDQIVMNGNNDVSSYIADKGWIMKFDPCKGTIENNRPRGLITFDRDVQIKKDLAVIDGVTTLNYLSVINDSIFEQNLTINGRFTVQSAFANFNKINVSDQIEAKSINLTNSSVTSTLGSISALDISTNDISFSTLYQKDGLGIRQVVTPINVTTVQPNISSSLADGIYHVSGHNYINTLDYNQEYLLFHVDNINILMGKEGIFFRYTDNNTWQTVYSNS